MGCNCKWTEVAIGLVILILTLWPNFIGMMATKWVVGIAAALLIVHAFMCKNCGVCGADIPKKSSRRSSRRKRRR